MFRSPLIRVLYNNTDKIYTNCQIAQVRYGYKTTDYLFLICIMPVVVIQYVTIRRNVQTQKCIIVIECATSFVCKRPPSSGFTFHKYKKEIHIAEAVHKIVKYYGRNFALI